MNGVTYDYFDQVYKFRIIRMTVDPVWDIS